MNKRRWALVLVFKHEIGERAAPLRYFWTRRAARKSLQYHDEFVQRTFPGGKVYMDLRRSSSL